jgi:hypothetical protein
MCPLKNSYDDILTLNVVCRRWSLWEVIRSQGETLINWILTLIEKTPKSPLVLTLPSEDTT